MAGSPAKSLHWHTASYFDWIIIFRRLRLEAPVQCVGYALASHADWDTGDNAFPGLNVLALETGYRSNHTIIDALKVLRDLKLIMRRESGSKSGRRGNADAYQLTLTNALREAAGEEPCECDPADRAALDGHVHQEHMLHVHMIGRNRCRSHAYQMQIRCTSCTWGSAEHVHQVHTNSLSIPLPYERSIE